MRLIDANSLRLKEFFGSAIPPYAILSHAWGEEEVTFQEWERVEVDKSIKRKAGYAKITGACRRAREDGLKYLWCDTNCIDKRNSTELAEAINSMFAWYRDSAICYAYLADVKSEKATISQSRWFTRGWTLQELLAPSHVVFFTHHWTMLGDKKALANMISNITMIHVGALRDRETIPDYSIAQRMSWAADRHTTRLEDVAYCLLGIFDINMPLLYGEGQKAFTRLQLEIIKVSDDQSILAWELHCTSTHLFTSALATSPAEFRYCGSIVTNHETQRNAYSITNLGVSIKLALIKTAVSRIVLVGLNCAKELYREAPHPQIPNERIKLYRHFRVWIPLYYLDHHTYFRVHRPSSTLFLEGSYSTLRHPTPTTLYLSLKASPSPATRLVGHSTDAFRRNSSISSSGLLVMISVGRIMPYGNALKEAYPLGEVTMLVLKRRSPSAPSHHLLSCGDLSIIFSVFWDADWLPQDWSYTVIPDRKLGTSSHMTSQLEWGCLFDLKCPIKDCNSVFEMKLLHQKLRQKFGDFLSTFAKNGKDPIVTIENEPLRDSFGRFELIVEIVFRETPHEIHC